MSEEKTRIVPRPNAKPGGEQITFHCDNGHRIVIPAKLAGKRGTCSKCGIAVVIPLTGVAKSEDRQEQVAPASDTAAPPVVAAAGQGPPTTADFTNLFAGAASAADEVVIDVTGGPEGSVVGGSSMVGGVVAGAAPEEFAAIDEAVVAENPTAQLVARLWLERNHGGKVELHLVGGGSPIIPEWYEARWSRGTHGLFASQAADGTVTLTAVAWDAVQKIVVRQVQGLPDGMFE